MRSLLWWVSAAVCLCSLAGCAASRDTSFYVLTPVPATERPKEVASGKLPVVGLHPVDLPEHLDHPQIVTRVGENMLQLAEFDQWAAPLRENVTRVLAENLTVFLPADHVAVFPWGKDNAMDYEVTVEVARLDGALGGACSIEARWAIFRKGDRAPAAAGKSSHSELAGNSYTALVSAQSRLLAALARDIAAALKAIPPLGGAGRAHPRLLQHPAPHAFFTGFGDGAVNLELRV